MQHHVSIGDDCEFAVIYSIGRAHIMLRYSRDAGQNLIALIA